LPRCDGERENTIGDGGAPHLTQKGVSNTVVRKRRRGEHRARFRKGAPSVDPDNSIVRQAAVGVHSRQPSRLPGRCNANSFVMVAGWDCVRPREAGMTPCRAAKYGHVTKPIGTMNGGLAVAPAPISKDPDGSDGLPAPHGLINFALRPISGVPITLLDFPYQLVTTARCLIQLVVRQSAPLLLCLPLDLFPAAFDLVPVHRTHSFLFRTPQSKHGAPSKLSRLG
jgi:hypothetical protein